MSAPITTVEEARIAYLNALNQSGTAGMWRYLRHYELIHAQNTLDKAWWFSKTSAVTAFKKARRNFEDAKTYERHTWEAEHNALDLLKYLSKINMPSRSTLL